MVPLESSWYAITLIPVPGTDPGLPHPSYSTATEGYLVYTPEKGKIGFSTPALLLAVSDRENETPSGVDPP
jgi:hypothetical protein